MKAIVHTKYGSPDVLQLTEVAKPSPADKDILVRVFATTVTVEEPRFRQGSPMIIRLFMGLFKPKNSILGSEFSGVIEATGKDIKRFKQDDQVFGYVPMSMGANAEYLCVAEDECVDTKPDNLSYDEAAAISDGSLTALHFLKNLAKLQSGQEILINGASGSVGTAAVQIAKGMGATVTGVCSISNLELVKSLGADKVIDYTSEDFTTTGHTYDVILDAVGKSSFSRSKASLKPQGVYLTTGFTVAIHPQMLWTAMFGGKKAKTGAAGLRSASDKNKDLVFILELIKAGALKPVIDRRYPLEQVADAHRFVSTGRKKGNVVITIVADTRA